MENVPSSGSSSSSSSSMMVVITAVVVRGIINHVNTGSSGCCSLTFNTSLQGHRGPNKHSLIFYRVKVSPGSCNVRPLNKS